MGKRKEAVAATKKAPARKAKKQAPALPKVAEKKAKRRTMQERAGLNISPGRCRRILGNAWRGGKISKVCLHPSLDRHLIVGGRRPK